ncbi:G-protein coupled receptor family C group 5 member C [Trichomycterus rosablanca]|uniref:G-protein coupled receptor family C group 5 member C n=1 Tax=Trichomycterus rosablanca TaxID=2290929 RepID=UPI002F3576C9
MEFFILRSFRALVFPLFVAISSLPGTTGAPRGCDTELNSIYYYLCDLDSAWGIVVEALAVAGVLTSFILLVVLLASLPFMPDKRRRRSLPLDIIFVLATLGLFGLTFAFIVRPNFATCSSRRFLFGVLFAACFSCLLMKAVKLNCLSRRNTAPRAWTLCLGALAFWSVEVIINIEWMIITMVRYPINDTGMLMPCNIANMDFAMALIYVMVLMAAVLMASITVLGGKHRRWYKDGLFILFTTLLSIGIWVAWIVMYNYGNAKHGRPITWDDPTLAITLVANAWVFLLFYMVPEICHLSDDGDEGSGLIQDIYANHGVGYETVLKEQRPQNIAMDNKAFSMDEPNTGHTLVSPYSGYNGQVRSSVYQPTELALITKGTGNTSMDLQYDTSIPRASLGIPHAQSPSTIATSSVQSDNGPKHTSNGNGLHWKTQW